MSSQAEHASRAWTTPDADAEGTGIRTKVPEATPGRSRVLIVDDEKLIRRALRRALSGEHDVVLADGARAALGALSQGEFDVILCDLEMPGMSGMDFYREVQSRAPGVERSIVFITGGAFTAAARAFLRSTENEMLEKPFDIDRLRHLVRSRAPDR